MARLRRCDHLHAGAGIDWRAARRNVPGLAGGSRNCLLHSPTEQRGVRDQQKAPRRQRAPDVRRPQRVLQSALRALEIPVDSQAFVFSKTSFQQKRISETSPRALFFNDRVALGWVRDGEIIEVAAQDARQGMVFYTLDQRPVEKPEFQRVFTCLGCHMAGDTLGVPGMLMFSTVAAAGGAPPRR